MKYAGRMHDLSIWKPAKDQWLILRKADKDRGDESSYQYQNLYDLLMIVLGHYNKGYTYGHKFCSNLWTGAKNQLNQ